MTDLTPFLAVPETDDFAAARAALLAGAAKWRQVKDDLREALGEFFYTAALTLNEKDYKRLLTLGATEFELTEDTIIRWRKQYQLTNGLVPPTPKSLAQQKRSIEKTGGASARATFKISAGEGAGSAAAVAPPAEPPSQEHPVQIRDVPPAHDHPQPADVGPGEMVLGSQSSPGPTPSGGVAAFREGAGETGPTGTPSRPSSVDGSASPSGGHGSAEEQDGDNRVSGAAAAVTPDDGPNTDTPGLRPTAPVGPAAHGAAGEPQTTNRVHETRGLTDPPASVADLNILLLRIGRTPENFWFNADAYAFSKAFWVLDRENARRRAFGGNGSLKREQVQPRPKAETA